MKKGNLILMCIIVWYICFYAISELCKVITSNGYIITIVSFLIPSIIVTILYHYMLSLINNRNDKVKEYSTKYKKILDINKEYDFKNVDNELILEENEFSIKSFNDILAKQVLLYRIENNEDNIREWIENAIINEKLYKQYDTDIKSINDEMNTSLINKTGLDEKKFKKIEKNLIENIKYTDNVYKIRAHVIVYFLNKDYTILNKKDRYIFYDEIIQIYEEWKQGKKYNESTKKERKLMNYSLRKEVLKRDGYKCCICGKTEKDGIRLEIDHIIPVSKGGQSTISNLQTLCSSCNAKKNTLDNDTYRKKYIKNKLVDFRKNRSKELNIPAYYVFTNDELDKILKLMPKNFEELKESKILPNVKLYNHGELIIKVITDKTN